MAYYVCHDCGKIFHEYDTWRVTCTIRDTETPIKETWERCPACGGDDFGFACRCEKCGDLFAPEMLRGGYYCDRCVSALSTFDRIKEFLEENIDCYAEFLRDKERKSNGIS